MQRNETLLEDSLLLIWNNRDAQQRLEKMKEIYAPDIFFYESEEGAAIEGHEAVNNTITKLQSAWPSGFVFELTQPARVNHNIQHIAWSLGMPAEAPAASGMDIAIIEEDKIKSLHLFLDAPVSK